MELMAVQLCKVYGARRIIALDPIRFRRQKTEAFGTHIGIDQTTGAPEKTLQKLYPPLGVDVAVSATSAGDVPNQALASTRLEGVSYL